MVQGSVRDVFLHRYATEDLRPTHDSGTAKGLLKGVVPTQETERPQDLIPKRDPLGWAGTANAVASVSPGQGPVVGLAGLEPAASSLSAIEGSPLCNPAFSQVACDRRGSSNAL
jgi:hypothetical protein